MCNRTGQQIQASYSPGSAAVKAEVACGLFGKDVPELKKTTQFGHINNCAQLDNETQESIPTNTSGFYIAKGQKATASAPGNSISATINILRANADIPDPRSITCTLPRTQADICTATRSYFVVL